MLGAIPTTEALVDARRPNNACWKQQQQVIPISGFGLDISKYKLTVETFFFSYVHLMSLLLHGQRYEDILFVVEYECK